MMQLFNEDCLDVMRRLADKSVDLILTDPPYGIGEAAGKNKSRSKIAEAKDYGNLDWDNATPGAEYFSEIMRVSRHQVIFGGNYFIEHLKNSPCWIVWDKDNGENDFADCELAWCSFSSAVRRLKYRWAGMLQQDMKNKEHRIHPTQKPVRLFEWILEKYAEPGWTIMDPFLGSGSTAIAANRLGFDFIGVEREQTYFEAALERIPRETAQQALF
jgi:site-specific DNA-methyltransferase (adenine-specific)